MIWNRYLFTERGSDGEHLYVLLPVLEDFARKLAEDSGLAYLDRRETVVNGQPAVRLSFGYVRDLDALHASLRELSEDEVLALAQNRGPRS